MAPSLLFLPGNLEKGSSGTAHSLNSRQEPLACIPPSGYQWHEGIRIKCLIHYLFFPSLPSSIAFIHQPFEFISRPLPSVSPCLLHYQLMAAKNSLEARQPFLAKYTGVQVPLFFLADGAQDFLLVPVSIKAIASHFQIAYSPCAYPCLLARARVETARE